MNKTQEVLKHLNVRGHITSWTAIEKYGATRLAAIIFELRRKGYDIKTVMKDGKDRLGNPCHYADYVLGQDPKEGQMSLW